MLNSFEIKLKKGKINFDGILLFLCKECEAHLQMDVLPKQAAATLQAYLTKNREFFKVGKIANLTYVEGKNLQQIFVVGCGEGKECTSQNFRKNAGEVARFIQKQGVKNILLYAPILNNPVRGKHLQAIVEGMYLGAYDFSEFKSAPKKKDVITVNIQTTIKDAADIIKKATIIAESVCFARNLINRPGNVVYPEIMANFAKQVAKENKLKIEILDEKKLLAKKMNAICAVGQGSVHKPRMIVLKYNGNGKAPYTAYVGKGITFDSGGISIKPTDGMGEMKDDMSGAADVLATIRAVAQLKLKVNLLVVLACAENMPGGNAQRPGDIVKAANGKTIEVITTDAEGRMVLADAVWYACELGATKVVDIATLTGAAIIALGRETAAIVANNDELAQKVIDAGKAVGESYWQLPTFEEYHELIKSLVADLKNSGGRSGGTITGGLFIGEFIKKGVQWVHLDIGGTSFVDRTHGFKPQGGSAFGVMTLIKLGEN